MQSRDGDVELSVVLDTKGLESDVQKIKKKIEKGVGGTTKTKPVVDSVATKQATQEVSKMETALEKAKEQARSLYTQLEEAKSAKVPTDEYKGLEDKLKLVTAEAAKVGESVYKMEMLGDTATKKYAELAKRELQLSAITMELDKEMVALTKSGEAFTQGNTEEVKSLQTQYDAVINKIALLTEKQEEVARASSVQQMMQQQEQLAESAKQVIRLGSEEWYALSPKERVSETLKALQNVIFKNKELKESMQNVSKFGVEGWYNLTPGERMRTMVDSLKNSFTNLGKKAVEFGQEVKNSFASAGQAIGNTIKEMFNSSTFLNKLGSIFSKISGNIDNLFKKILSFTKAGFHRGIQKLTDSFKRLAPAVHNTGHAFKLNIANILGMALGIRGLYGLIGKLKSMISEGIQYLAQYNNGNNETNRSISMLLTSLNQLKGAWASAFAPILNAVAPILNYLIGLLTKVANAIAQFMSLLAGKSTWMKATAAQQNFAKGMDKTGSSAKKANKEAEKLKGTLAGFDDLDVLNPQEDNPLDDMADDLGGAGGGAEVPITFEEVPIDPWFKDLLDKLKEMWENADFTELGKAIGEWLKKALDSIPWDIIKKFARKLAKSIATFINGFIEVEGLGKSIGKTLAEAINTAFEFLDEFVRDLHWDSLGKFIGEGLLSFVETIDYDLIGGALGAGLWGAIQAAFYTVKTFTEGEGWETLSEGIGTIINRFIEELGKIDEDSGLNGWEMAGDTAYNIIHGIITSLINVIESIPTDEILQGFQDFMNRVNWEQIGVDLNTLANSIIMMLADLLGDNENWQLVGEKLADFLNGIDFVSIGADLGHLALSVLEGIGEGFKSCKSNLSASNKFVLGMAEAIIAGLLIVGGMTKLASIGLQLFSFMPSALQTSMIQALGAMVTDGGFLAAVGTAGATIAGALAAAIGGYFAGLKLGELIFPEDAMWYKDFSWDQIFGNPEDLLEGLKLWFQDIWDALPDAIRIMITASNPFLSIGMAIVDGLLEGMGITSFSTGFKDFWEGLILWVKDIFGIHSPSTVFMEIGDNLVQGFLDGLKEKYEAVIEFFTGLFDAIIAVWEAFKATIAGLWEAFKSAVAERLETLRTDIETKWNTIKSKSQEIWTLLKEKVIEIVTKLKESAQEKVNLIKEKILEIWTKLKEGTIEKFNLIKEKIIDVFEKVKEGIKAPINGALEIIEGFVNTVIRGLNFFIESINSVIGKITSSLPSDVVSKIGLEGALTIEPIPEISLPRLARGAVIPPNKEFLAVLGDQKNGTNIEAPLDTIKEAFADVVANMNVQNSGYAEMELDGETFARLIVPYVISELKREGFNVSVIGA